MELNKKELRKIMYDFNSICNRLIKSDFNDYENNLKKFISFLMGNELIYEYIKDCGSPSYDVKTEVETVQNLYGSIFELGNSNDEEVTNIFHLLKYCTENDIIFSHGITFGYSNSNKYQDKLDSFNARVVMVLITHIEIHLTKIGIDMGIDETIKYNITANGGQVNVAADSSTINATQNNGIDTKLLAKLLVQVQELAKNLTSEEQEEVHDFVETIQLLQEPEKPKKSLIRTALLGLKGIKGTVEFGAAVTALVQFLQTALK
ncbi:hypothetical protein [Lactococcus sp.]|uniref:hypothetical protein n=1 Tax=Lactococcus sp. TaxID=44273 RepID=UPI002FCBEE67